MKGASSKGSGKRKPPARMDEKGQAFIRLVVQHQEKITEILQETTGRTISHNSFIGLASELLMVTGQDPQNHAASTLPMKSDIERRAAALLTTMNLVLRAHRETDFSRVREILDSYCYYYECKSLLTSHA